MMLYTSTRNKAVHVSSAQAIAQGISAEGGLFVPEEIPKLSMEQIAALAQLDYIERAKAVLSLYLTDFTPEELDRCVRGAYAAGQIQFPKSGAACPSDGGYPCVGALAGADLCV